MSFRDRLSDFTKHIYTQQTVLLSAFSFSLSFSNSFSLFPFPIALGEVFTASSSMDGRHGNFLLCQTDRGSVALGVAFSKYNGWGGSQIHFALPLPTPNPSSSSSPSPLSSGFFFLHPLFFPYGRTVQSEKGKSAESRRNQRTAALPPPEHSPEPRLPSRVPPALPTAPLVSPPLAPRPHMLRSSTE